MTNRDEGGRIELIGGVNHNPARSVKWIVVRVPGGGGGAETLKYEEGLGELGVTAWTPAMWIHKRLPRRRLRVWELRAILPGYLFLDVRGLPNYGSLPFSIRQEVRPFLIQGKYVVLGDQDLEGLREFDNRVKPEGRKVGGGKSTLPGPESPVAVPVPEWVAGDSVRVKGVLGGMEGVVVAVNPQTGEATVALRNSPAKVKVSGFLLERGAVYTNHGRSS